VEEVNQIPWKWEADETLKNNNPIIISYIFLLFLITTKCIHVCWWRSTNLDGNWGKIKP
jgi:hypothetical protein